MKIFLICSLILITSCATMKTENCMIKKIMESRAINENSYYIRVKFGNCANKEDRIDLVKKEFYKISPITDKSTITISEFLDKVYQVYRYDIIIE